MQRGVACRLVQRPTLRTRNMALLAAPAHSRAVQGLAPELVVLIGSLLWSSHASLAPCSRYGLAVPPVHSGSREPPQLGSLGEGCLPQDDDDRDADGNAQADVHASKQHAKQGRIEDDEVELVDLRGLLGECDAVRSRQSAQGQCMCCCSPVGKTVPTAEAAARSRSQMVFMRC